MVGAFPDQLTPPTGPEVTSKDKIKQSKIKNGNPRKACWGRFMMGQLCQAGVGRESFICILKEAGRKVGGRLEGHSENSMCVGLLI